MPFRDLAMLDDATFDATGVRVTDGCVVLHGSVVERGTSVGTARLPVTLTVSDAVDVTVDLAGGTGDLVLDRVEVTLTTVSLVGVVPARVVVTMSVQSQALLEVRRHRSRCVAGGAGGPGARADRWSSTIGPPQSGCGPRPVRSGATRGPNTRSTRTKR